MSSVPTLTTSSDIVTIPLDSTFPWFFFTIALSGAIYTLHFRFDTRMNHWIMDVHDAQDNDILDGIPLLIERNLIGRFSISALPPGMFYVLDTSGQGTEPTRYSFGTTHVLAYYDPLGIT